jgi:hypothetical protein
MKRWLWILIAVWVSGTAEAQQLKYEIKKGGGQWQFTAVWKDAAGERQKIKFTLPAEVIKEDLEEPVYVGLQKIGKVAARDINQHNFGKGVTCKATVNGNNIQWRCQAPNTNRTRAAMAKCQEIYDERTEIWLQRHGMKEDEDGVVTIDWGRHVRDYADDLAPVVRGLGGPTPDPRDFAAKALGFVQTIPYETRGAKPDKFRRPLSILGRNRGDCDSKTVLYLSLMHQAYPELGLGVVSIKHHAFGAVALAPRSGDITVKVHGTQWVALEPVGPHQAEIGTVGRNSRRALRFRRFDVHVAA